MRCRQTEATPFWLVWQPHGRSPIFRHATDDGAKAEAGRLARENPGLEFYVLESRCVITKEDLVIQHFEPTPAEDTGIPF